MHEVQVTLVGYSKTTVSNVRVQNDLTAEINIKLDQSTVELNEVTVTAEQKLVQKDVTSTRRTVGRRDDPGNPRDGIR